MQEIPLPLSGFIIEARQKIPIKTDVILPTGELEINALPDIDIYPKNQQFADELAKRYNIDFVSYGKDSLVFISPWNQNQVYKIPWTDFEMPPKKAKEIYYLHKLFATLLPHNIPQIHGAWGIEPTCIPPKYHPGFIVSRISGTSHRDSSMHSYFPDIWTMSKRWGIPIDIDQFGSNFIWGKNGDGYYIDQIFFKKKNPIWQPTKLYSEMNSNPQYSRNDFRIAQMCINRLSDLGIVEIK